MTWTTPRTWTVGETVTAAMMNAHVRDNESALYPPRAAVYRSGTATITTNTWTTVSFDSEQVDSDGLHDVVTNTSRLTVPAGMGGTWRVWGKSGFAETVSAVTGLRIEVNGALAISGKGDRIEIVLALNAGDYAELQEWQNSGGNVTSQSGSTGPWFGMHRLLGS